MDPIYIGKKKTYGNVPCNFSNNSVSSIASQRFVPSNYPVSVHHFLGHPHQRRRDYSVPVHPVSTIPVSIPVSGHHDLGHPVSGHPVPRGQGQRHKYSHRPNERNCAQSNSVPRGQGHRHKGRHCAQGRKSNHLSSNFVPRGQGHRHKGRQNRPKRKIPKKGWLGYFDKNRIFTKLSQNIYLQLKNWCIGYITYKPKGFETKDKYIYFYDSQIFIKDWDRDRNMYEYKPLLELFV